MRHSDAAATVLVAGMVVSVDHMDYGPLLLLLPTLTDVEVVVVVFLADIDQDYPLLLLLYISAV
jgi:hypothetical protein